MGAQFNLRAVTIASTGTGTLTLGAAVAPFKALSAAPAVPTGAFLSYRIDHGSDWELSEGIYNSAAGTITRNLVESSTGSLINITGSATVALVPHARDFPPQSNMTATVAPTASDDGSLGYSVGSQWLWAARGQSWTCINSASGAAVWAPNASNLFASPRRASSPLIHSDFFHFMPGYAFNNSRGPENTYTENGATFSASAYLGSTTGDGQIGVAAVRTVGTASIQRPTFAVNNDRQTVTAGNGMTHGVAGRIKLRPAAVPNAPSAVNDYSHHLRFGPSGSNRVENSMVAFDYYWDGSAVVFQARSRSNGGAINQTSLTVPTADAYAIWATEVEGTTARFYVGGQLVATHTGLASNLQLRPMWLTNQVTAPSANGADIDWLEHYILGMPS